MGYAGPPDLLKKKLSLELVGNIPAMEMPVSNPQQAAFDALYTLISVTGNYSVKLLDRIILSPGGPGIIITLPSAVAAKPGWLYSVKSTGLAVQVEAVVGFIDGRTFSIVPPKGSQHFVSDGANWWIL